MAIRFFRFKRKINNNGIVVEKYMANMQKETTIDFEKMSEMIEKKSSMSRGDIMGILMEVETVSADMLLLGHTIELGALGTLVPSMQATACDNPEDVTSQTIKRFHPIFKPSKYLKKKFKEAVFHLGDNKVREVRYKKKD